NNETISDNETIYYKTTNNETTDNEIINKITNNEITNDETIVIDNDNNLSDIFFAVNKETIALAHELAVKKSALESEDNELLETLNDIDNILFEVGTESTFSTENNEELALSSNTNKNYLELKSYY
ncbi:3679_t:CDS:1, partial [Ambispora leptoticha]